VFVSRSTDAGATWKTFTADNSTSHHHLFDPVKVGDDGTVYVCWSDDHAIYLTHSLDHGVTWAPAVKASGPETASRSSMARGRERGRVACGVVREPVERELELERLALLRIDHHQRHADPPTFASRR
jgi:photosystem II stability/assembly factor-like uncharacterized protein